MTRALARHAGPSARGWRGPLAAFLGLLALFAAGEWNSTTPVLRFAHPAWNRAALLAIYALPTLAVFPALRLPRAARVAAILLLLPLLLFTGFFSLLIWDDLQDLRGGVDSSLEPLQTLEAGGGSRVVAYRTNCGATCAYGITVRQERPLGGGLLLVRPLTGFYPADTAVLAPAAGGRVRVTAPGSRARQASAAGAAANTRIVTPLPWVYF